MELIVYNITYWAKSELWGCDWAVPTAGFYSKSVTTTNQSGKRNSVLFDSYCDQKVAKYAIWYNFSVEMGPWGNI